MVVALCAVIPLIGSTLSMITVPIVAFTFSPTQGLVTLAFFLTYQQFDNYFIQPRVFQRSVSVPGPLVILAAVCGGLLYGLLGALLAIPLDGRADAALSRGADSRTQPPVAHSGDARPER